MLLAAPAPAQDAQDATDSLTAVYREALARTDRLAILRESLAGEDSLVVVREIETSAVDASRALVELSRQIASDDEAATAAPDSAVAAEYRELATLLWAGEVSIVARLDATRVALFRAGSEDVRRLERELGERERRLSLVHDVLLDHVDATERIGLDVRADRERLIDRVSARGQTLAARVRYLASEIKELESQASFYPEDTELPAEIKQASLRKDLYLETLESVVRQLSVLEQPTAELENVLVVHTGDISRTILDPTVATSILSDWMTSAREWVADNGVSFGFKILFFVLIMAIATMVARIVRRAVERALNGPKVRISHLLRKMIIGFSGNLVLLTGVLIALSQVGVNLAPILAGVGVVGFIVGFALQETLANFAAGMMILFYRPYDVGDLVEVSGVFGKVEQMSLVSTTILTIDNQTLVVPNGKIWGDVIRNVTAQHIRRVDLVFGIAYSDDIPKAEKILESILAEHELVLADPEPMVKLHTLNESSVDFIVRPWVKTDDYWDVHWDVTREVKMRFDAEGVSIPFPQRDVHHFVDGAPAIPVVAQGEAGRSPRPASGIPDDPNEGDG
jgi:small conductance mechanosensitive channel